MSAPSEIWAAIQAGMAAELPAPAAAATTAAAALCERLPAHCHLIASKVLAAARARLEESRCAARARSSASDHV